MKKKKEKIETCCHHKGNKLPLIRNKDNMTKSLQPLFFYSYFQCFFFIHSFIPFIRLSLFVTRGIMQFQAQMSKRTQRCRKKYHFQSNATYRERQKRVALHICTSPTCTPIRN